MHNWWLAVLEKRGIISREEAESLSTDINNAGGKESYKTAYEYLDSMLKSAHLDERDSLATVTEDIKRLEARVAALSKPEAVETLGKDVQALKEKLQALEALVKTKPEKSVASTAKSV
jgi:polyhydroxyalkanoate synthesis regulator phasin